MEKPFININNGVWGKILGFTMSVIIMTTAWLLNQAWEKINKIEIAIHEIQVSSATMSANKFTANDWMVNKSVLDAERLAQERRIMKMEETLPVIKDSLLTIGKDIKEHMEKDRK